MARKLDPGIRVPKTMSPTELKGRQSLCRVAGVTESELDSFLAGMPFAEWARSNTRTDAERNYLVSHNALAHQVSSADYLEIVDAELAKRLDGLYGKSVNWEAYLVEYPDVADWSASVVQHMAEAKKISVTPNDDLLSGVPLI